MANDTKVGASKGSSAYKASIPTKNIYGRVVALCGLFQTVDRGYDKDQILLEIAIWQAELSRRGSDTIMAMLSAEGN